MNVAITGASGDIGGAFLAHAAQKSSIKALVRKGKPLRVVNPSIERFDFQDGYIYKADFLRRFTHSDAVVHCAALLNTTGDDLIDYFAINALLTGLLTVSCLRHEQPPKFVYVSSEMVYTLAAADRLRRFSAAFVAFCKKNFSDSSKAYDLRALASTFIKQNHNFPYDQYNLYALTKYLGEAITQAVPRAVVLRVTSAYGPDYANPRLIPRLMVARLTGHGATYPKEKRDFVYSSDINRLIDAVISKDCLGIVDCKSDEITDTKDLRDTIVHLTPTAYGSLIGTESPRPHVSSSIKPADTSLRAIIGEPMPFADGLVATLRHHKEQCYHEMTDARVMEDFLKPGERIIEELKGSSAAYLFVVAGTDGIRKVRKVAIRDGVEGNGIAKVANEIRYYKHIAKHEPKLAAMYPRLLDSQTAPTFSSETIEYLEGQNYYAALRSADLPFEVYKDSLQRLINSLSDCALEKSAIAKSPEDNLDAYYIERSLSRLQSIRSLVRVEDTIRINGSELLAPHIILADLLRNKQLRRFILPHIECFCFHGDLTLLNAVFLSNTHEIRLIDPRGHTGAWDPLYDFAKLKFTLSGFGEFILSPEPLFTKTAKGYDMDFDLIPTPARRLNDVFLDMLAVSEQFQARVINREPYWRYRVRLAETTHYLADIPFRLFTDETSWTAVASYIVGTYYLNQVYEELRHDTTFG